MAWLTLFLATCTIGVQICWAGQQYKPKPSNSTTGSAEWLDKPSKRQCLVLWKKVREDGLLRLLMIPHPCCSSGGCPLAGSQLLSLPVMASIASSPVAHHSGTGEAVP